MTQKELQAYPSGIYRIFWKRGGTSIAAVGLLHDGRRWFAPTNWTAQFANGIVSTAWRLVKSMDPYFLVDRELES